MEVGFKSTFKTGPHVILTIARLSHDLCDYIRIRVYLALPSLVDMSINN